MSLNKREEELSQRDEDEEEVDSPGLPRRPASAINLRPKPDHRRSERAGICSMPRLSRTGGKEAGG